jgi:hypothetical protein
LAVITVDCTAWLKKVLQQTEQPWTTVAEEKKNREEQSVVSLTD